MAIQLLQGSYEEHRTVEGIEIKTIYLMDWADYYHGWGPLYQDTTYVYDMYLPWEGDNFGTY